MKAAALACTLLLASALSAHALSPPWWIAANSIEATLGADKFVTVKVAEQNVNGSSLVRLTATVANCCNTAGRRLQGSTCIANCAAASNKAKALSTLLSLAVKKANSEVGNRLAATIKYQGQTIAPGAAPKSAKALANTVKAAMLGNAYFDSVVEQPLLMGGPAAQFVVFQPKVAQVYVDDIGQLNGLRSLLVTDLFDQVYGLKAAFPAQLYATTDRCNGVNCIVTA